MKEDRHAFAARPHNRAGLRQGESAEFIRPAVRAGSTRGPGGHFAPVKVNDILTLDFDDSDNPRSNHYRLPGLGRGVRRVLQRVKDEGVATGGGPRSRTDGEINYNHGDAGSTSSARTGMCGGYYAHVYYGVADGGWAMENEKSDKLERPAPIHPGEILEEEFLRVP